VGKLTISRRYNQATLAAVKPWGDSQGAGRIGLTQAAKVDKFTTPAKRVSKKIVFL